MVGDMQALRSEQSVAIFAERLAVQATLQDFIEEQIAVEFDLLVTGVTVTGELRRALYLAALERAGGSFDTQASWRTMVPVGQHANVEVVVESVGARISFAYEDYLLRHWSQRPSGQEVWVDDAEWIQQALADHIAAFSALLAQGGEGGTLAGHIEVLQREWAAQAF